MKQFVIAGAVMALLAAPAHAADMPMTPSRTKGAMGLEVPRPEAADFKAVPGVPACTTIAALRGDSAKEGATLMVRMTSGCVVPFHWHHATEEVVMLQGTAFAQMLGGKPYALRAGSYSQLPKEHVHRMRCASREDCYNFVVADRAFDIIFVDARGKPISTAAALAASAGDKGVW